MTAAFVAVSLSGGHGYSMLSGNLLLAVGPRSVIGVLVADGGRGALLPRMFGGDFAPQAAG